MKTFLLGFALLLGIASFRHPLDSSEGIILYEVTVNNHRNLTPEREGMKAMIPKFRTFKQRLLFNANESLYLPFIEEENDDEVQGQGQRFRRFRQNTIQYTDLGSDIIITQNEMMGKKYLISDTLKPAPWKFGTETKVILGYECSQAYYTKENERKQTITVWFTSQLRPSLGPEGYNTLPGTVLAVDVNNGERVILAKNIELKKLSQNELKRPTEGQKVTSEELQKIMQDRRNAMGGRRQGNE